jgi:hypothetical protein
MTTVDPHIQLLRDLLRTEHEARIAELQQWADEAGADGDMERQQRYLARVDSLKAIPYPWEKPHAA